MREYPVIDETGDVCATFDDRKDAELYIAENSQHKLEIAENETETND